MEHCEKPSKLPNNVVLAQFNPPKNKTLNTRLAGVNKLGVLLVLHENDTSFVQLNRGRLRAILVPKPKQTYNSFS